MSNGQHRITFEDRGGGTLGTSIIVHGAPDNAAGVHAEYEFLARKFGTRGADWRPLRQSTGETKGRRWDRIVVALANGRKKAVYFDITEFFGKR